MVLPGAPDPVPDPCRAGAWPGAGELRSRDRGDGRRVCRYILTHLGEDLSVGSLCRTFATNHTSLYRQFKAHTGLPVSEYVLSKRLEAAKSSLAFTSLSLAEIARECGFRESAYLARVFKQHVGTTPLSYRTAMRKKRMG